MAWLAWAAATGEMLSAFDANLARNGGLSQAQFFVLLLLKRNPAGLSVGALAQGVAVTPPCPSTPVQLSDLARMRETVVLPTPRVPVNR